jgi:hypothetical protein
MVGDVVRRRWSVVQTFLIRVSKRFEHDRPKRRCQTFTISISDDEMVGGPNFYMQRSDDWMVGDVVRPRWSVVKTNFYIQSVGEIRRGSAKQRCQTFTSRGETTRWSGV